MRRIDDETRAAIALAAAQGVPQVDVAEEFGVSQQSVSTVLHEYQRAMGTEYPSDQNLIDGVLALVAKTTAVLNQQLQLEHEEMAVEGPKWVKRYSGQDLAAMYRAKSQETRKWLEYAARVAGRTDGVIATDSSGERE